MGRDNVPVILTPAAGAQGAILGRGTPQGWVFTIPSPGYRTTALPPRIAATSCRLEKELMLPPVSYTVIQYIIDVEKSSRYKPAVHEY